MVKLVPLTPRSLKVQIALMARFGSTHSGRKREVKAIRRGREPLGIGFSCVEKEVSKNRAQTRCEDPLFCSPSFLEL